MWNNERIFKFRAFLDEMMDDYEFKIFPLFVTSIVEKTVEIEIYLNSPQN